MPEKISLFTPASVITVARRLAVLGISLVLMTVAAQSIKAAALSDLAAPQLFLRKPNGRLVPTLATRSHLDAVIRGSVARVTFTQTFENNSDDWVNAVYAMPLPESAAVHGWTVDFAGRRLVGLIREREQAQRQYQQAVAEGRRAGLMESIDGGLFQVRIANIDPGVAVNVEVEMTLPVTIDGRVMSFRFPTTLTPRYRQQQSRRNGTGEDDLAASFWRKTLKDFEPTHEQLPVPAFVLGEVEYPFTWSIRLAPLTAVTRIETPLHRARFERDGSQFVIDSGDTAADMDRDFWLRWELAASSNPIAGVVVEQVDGVWYGSLDLLEPTAATRGQTLPRDLILVLDVSGSMSGESIRQAKAAVRFALSQLNVRDSFNVIAFDHRVFPLFDEPLPALPGNITEALEFIDALEADGGTEMTPALELALSQVLVDSDVFTQLVFLTDGAVGDEVALYQLIRSGLGNARLSTVAIGAAPNGAFMRQAAAAGRGLYRQIARVEDVQPVLNRLVKSLSSPLLTDIEVSWPGEVTTARSLSPDLYQGEPIRELVQFTGPPSGVVSVTGMLDGRRWRQDLTLDGFASGVGSGGAIAAMWAGQRVQSVLDQAVLAGLPTESVREQVLELGLEHHLVTPFTSLIAEELFQARPPSADAGTYLLPNQLPVTQFEFPQTATPAELWLYFGLLAGFVGVVLIAISREEGVSARNGKQ